ncbi:hypothetical protein CISIN_1g044101mg, partial [Citrus sinensis]
KMGTKIFETVKWKLSLGAIIIQKGGRKNILKQIFVLRPIKKIKNIYESENVNTPDQNYIGVVTVEDFQFWFMGFLRYEKACINLQKAISKSTKLND